MNKKSRVESLLSNELTAMQHMIVTRNSKKEYRFKVTVTSSRFLRRRAAPTEHQIFANLRQLMAEASHVARRARELDLAEAEQVAIQRIYGQINASTKASFACQSILAREIRAWLRRAELAARINGNIASTQNTHLLMQLRGLIDSANVAIMRGFKSHHAWSDFCSGADRAAPPASGSVCRRLPSSSLGLGHSETG
jgi:hypothetical protein